jgi:hypothetical protein
MARNALGHDVRLIRTQYVKPFLKGHKNDYRDAEAIAEAVQRPTMEFCVDQGSAAKSSTFDASRPLAPRWPARLQRAQLHDLDIQPGDWLKIGSQVASAGFATAGPNDWVRISAVAAKRILLDIVPAGWIAERAQVAAPLTYAPAIPFSAAGIRVRTVSVAISLSPTSHARRS